MSHPNKCGPILVIGAGIAGMSVAAKLASRGVSVDVLEQYGEYPYGATGRSAALLAQSYFSSPEFAKLTKATQPVLENPAAGFTDVELVRDRGALYFAGIDDAVELAKFCWSLGQAGIKLTELCQNDILDLVPILRKDKAVLAVFEEDAKDMDVDAIFRGFERQARRHGARIVPGAELLTGQWNGRFWVVHTPKGVFQADIIINAAGAWGDVVAQRCGVPTVGLRPLRRTAMVAQPANGIGASLPITMPFVFRAAEDLYWCKRADGFLISPADATPSDPCDARPEIEDVARAIQAFEDVTTIKLAASRPRAWAGLRTYAPDNKPVVGFEGCEARFFWVCGQGGYGIQTSDAMARLAEGLLLDGTVPAEHKHYGLEESDVSPARFRA